MQKDEQIKYALKVHNEKRKIYNRNYMDPRNTPRLNCSVWVQDERGCVRRPTETEAALKRT